MYRHSWPVQRVLLPPVAIHCCERMPQGVSVPHSLRRPRAHSQEGALRGAAVRNLQACTGLARRGMLCRCGQVASGPIMILSLGHSRVCLPCSAVRRLGATGQCARLGMRI
jgi:hypothetical protein